MSWRWAASTQVGQFARRIVAGRVLAVDRTEHERHVPPVVVLVGIELVDGQEFEHRHTQLT